jgi:hypothetical protein
MKDKLIPVAVGVLIGVVLANKLHALPVLNKLPQL